MTAAPLPTMMLDVSLSPDAAVPADPAEAARRRREQRAWYVYDWANSAYQTTTLTVLFGPYLTVIAKRAACPGQDIDLDCRNDLSLLGIPIAPGSLALYAVTTATLLSALLLPVVGAIADRSGRKRTLMARIAWTGAAAAGAMVFVGGTNWQLGVLLEIVATLCFASALVVYDAILCEIATPDERDAVSSKGWAAGYLGGGLLLALNLGLVTGHDAVGLSSEWAVRLSLLSAGVWWAAFTVIPYLGLRDRPAGARPAAVIGPGDTEQMMWGSVGGKDAGAEAVTPDHRETTGEFVRGAFSQLVRTLRHARGYPHTLLFLAAYLFYNDGIQTVIAAATIFGQEQLDLEQNQLIMTILLVQFVAFGGALLFGRIATRIGARRTIFAGLVLWCVVVALGYVLPAGRFLPFLVLAFFIGLVLGGTQALSRSLFSQMIPRGREAEYFSLYQCCERGTSWFGTFVFGLVYQLSGSYRYAILALIAFFVVGGVLLARVDVRRAIREAGNPEPALV
jgi:UMF1 family MFS transporter